jgi:CheY-like chemotaxis protein
VLNVTFVGTTDRQLEQSLHAAAMQVSVGEVAQLPVLASANAVQPDVLLLDLRNGYGLPPAVAALKRQHPSTAVLLLVKSLDPTLLLEAMRAGVNEVVAEPIDHEELAAAIHRVAGSRPQTEPGRVYGFIGAKGGGGDDNDCGQRCHLPWQRQQTGAGADAGTSQRGRRRLAADGHRVPFLDRGCA